MNTIGFILVTVAFATAYPQIRTMVQKLDGSARSSRITGGNEAIPHSIPHHAHLTVIGSNTMWSCSGSIISHYYILTSGRCVHGGVEVVVAVGFHNTSQPDSDQITYSTTNILIHPNYTHGSSYYRNDIALLKTDLEIPFTYKIQPIGLPTRQDLADGENFAGRVARASGWGMTDGFEDGSTSTVLKYVDGKILQNSECIESLPPLRVNSLLCVSGEGGICTGDVGGPLVADYKLVGISSFWFIFCMDGYPTGYTRVSSHMDWIVQNSDVEIV